MSILGLILVGLGAVMIGCGTYVSLYQWRKEQERLESARAKNRVLTEAAGVGEVLTGLAKLAEALKKHTLGMQLIIAGIGIVTLGGIIGGVAGIGKCA